MAGAFRGAECPEGNVRGCGDYKKRPFHASRKPGVTVCPGGRTERDGNTFRKTGNDGGFRER